MRSPRHAVIAAAGVGSRLGLGMPKCLVEVCGRRIIDYLLEALADVPHVRMVVGFRELEVMQHVRKVRRDVLFVRNPAFLHTTTLQSLHLGVRGLSEPCLILDGDTIYDRQSLRRLCELSADGAPTIGVSTDITEDPVYAAISERGGGLTGELTITGFSREQKSGYEWANVAVVPPALLTDSATAVFQRLSAGLPMRACAVDRLEIDTEGDLRRAEAQLGQSNRQGPSATVPIKIAS
jgi:CTP:molybdopterin cytidylyltransferase MocA